MRGSAVAIGYPLGLAFIIATAADAAAPAVPPTTDAQLALWGFIGAFVYAASKLIAALLGDQEISLRAKQRAMAQFGLALLFGPPAAIAITPVVLAHFAQAGTPSAVALGVGLSANALWPVFVDGMVPAMRKAAAQWFATVAKALDGKAE